ncbi:MAG TPA: glycosyltransferase [Pseudomonadales bacterium]|nr:glycosyltransferase [Pseudomonadales bacterium]HMZ71862.1 glycosyltransferase [Pseudomonadales bacterium]HMZ92868.1 glycosyltransferase [Pseudomonadales bacterium]HNH20350.1 glycosyltransferase [Pseudomonadales bacterium]
MIRVSIVYPTDPLGLIPGGTDTCIRDIIRCAPDDIEMQLVGVTTDPLRRPVGKWTRCEINGAGFDFYPLLAVADLTRQSRIPLSVRYTWRLLFDRPFRDVDVMHFDRIEPILPLFLSASAKVLILHQNMKVLHDKSSDIRWKYLPGGYFFLEKIILNRLDEIYIVREDAVSEYQKRFPRQSAHLHFLPTWMNPALFYLPDEADRLRNKQTLLHRFGWGADDPLMLFVGRLDHQKDPHLMVSAMVNLVETVKNTRLVLVGDGVLRGELEKMIALNGLEQHVKLFGVVAQEEVAVMLRSADLLLLSSAYEGMPRCVVEALGSGVPVVSTNVGEVSRLVTSGVNGSLVESRDPREFSAAILSVLQNIDRLRGAPCVDSVRAFQAKTVLSDLYQKYRQHAAR